MVMDYMKEHWRWVIGVWVVVVGIIVASIFLS